jgi:uncharacterized protein (TIGR03085 family)
MTSTNFARIERAAFADLLTDLGPDQPTLCAGWQTRDLAAHIVVRDRRPDAAAGAVIKSIAPHADRVRDKAKTRPWETLIDQVRRPPRLSLAGIGPLDRATNTSEFFVHHEDVRRAQPDWSPRPLDDGLAKALAGQIKFSAKFALRRFPARITIKMPGYAEPLVVGAGGEPVTITGDPGEMTLFLMGRQSHARVDLSGPDPLVTRLSTARLGV